MISLSSMGKVYLIGAGPGAADLITVRGANLLKQADVVLYDALVTEELLELCPQAKKIFVGKRRGKPSVTQQSINEYLLKFTQKYQIIVRLKGGDPMLFSRADEELRALENYNIIYEIVPGITAALAASASSQRPLTKRGIAYSVSLFTSCIAVSESNKFTMPNGDTLVQYMGGQETVTTARRLLLLGYAHTTPVIIVENCSCTNERIFTLQLSELEKNLIEYSGPVLVMIGDALAKR